MASIVFRFDVDTHKCARDGVPNLLRLGTETNTKFTFFVNCGRAVSVYETLSKKFNAPTHVSVHSAPQLSALQKLGKWDYLWAALVNPNILRAHRNEIEELAKHGHEIGLHGGRNHETWMSHAQNWNHETVQNEVHWGLNELRSIGITPTGFASPGARGSNIICKVLNENSFKYYSDNLDPNAVEFSMNNDLLSIPTKLCGEKGVAYIEAMRAQNFTDEQILNQFDKDLDSKSDLVMYDHPYYAGVVEIDLLRKMIAMCKAKSYKIVTMQELYEAKVNESRTYRKTGS